jgi:hypothetical protein
MTESPQHLSALGGDTVVSQRIPIPGPLDQARPIEPHSKLGRHLRPEARESLQMAAIVPSRDQALLDWFDAR